MVSWKTWISQIRRLFSLQIYSTHAGFHVPPPGIFSECTYFPAEVCQCKHVLMQSTLWNTYFRGYGFLYWQAISRIPWILWLLCVTGGNLAIRLLVIPLYVICFSLSAWSWVSLGSRNHTALCFSTAILFLQSVKHHLLPQASLWSPNRFKRP